MSKVSICIPAYNQPEAFQRALISINNQTYRDFEVIVTDDFTDASISGIVEKYKSELDITYIKNEDRLGTPKNWNEATRAASGDYIKILHHDDWFSNSDSLKKFVDILDRNPDSDFAFCSSINCDVKKNVLSINAPTKIAVDNISKDPTILFLANIIGSPSATIYRKKYQLEFDVAVRYVVDFDFYIRYLLFNPNISFLNEGLVYITNKSPYQVTHEFIWNRRETIFEYLYEYNKFNG